LEKVAERGIRWRPPQLQAECLGHDAVVADSETLQIPQTLATTHDSEQGHQQQILGRKPNPTPHTRIWDRPEVADWIEIGCSRGAFQHKEGAIQSTSLPKLTAPARRLVMEIESALRSLHQLILNIWQRLQ
jgi:hypothetical protein